MRHRTGLELRARDRQQQRHAGDFGGRDQAIHDADHLTHVRRRPVRQILDERVTFGSVDVLQVVREQLLAQRAVGSLHLDDQSALEAGAQALLQAVELSRRAVTGENELLPLAVQRVEDVKELLLGALFPGHELYVIDDQRVGAAIPHAPPIDGAVLQRRDQLVHELLRADARHHGRPTALVDDLVADRVREMRLSDAARSMNEERIVLLAGLCDHRVRRAHRELVALTDLERRAREVRCRTGRRRRTMQRA